MLLLVQELPGSEPLGFGLPFLYSPVLGLDLSCFVLGLTAPEPLGS